MKIRFEQDPPLVFYEHDDLYHGDFVKTSHIVTSVRRNPLVGDNHCRLTIFVRGMNAGSVIVNPMDAQIIAERLLKEPAK
jgi:hypothetical protein